MLFFRYGGPLQKLFGSYSQSQALYPAEVIRLFSSAFEVMKENEVVPDLVADAPTELLTATFPSGVSADSGNILTPTQVKDRPTVKFTGAAGAFHLLYFTDPDSPSRGRPTFREWHHWLVGNIPGDNVDQGEVLSDYISPCPPKATGKHRYVFLVFKQSDKLSFDEPRLTNKRTNGRELFKIKKLIAKYKLGAPIAGNLFLAEWDPYVDEFYERMSKFVE